MSPRQASPWRSSDRFPRVSGDEPWIRSLARSSGVFSPRERG